MAKAPSARAAAAWVLADVLRDGRSLATALPKRLGRVKPAERALTQELAYGTLRGYPRLMALLQPLLTKPLKAKDSDVLGLLLLGIYQLEYLSTAPHAAVAETVNAVAQLGKGWARGLVNAVLRNYQRQRAQLIASADADEATRLAHPEWLLSELKQAWPEQWEVIATTNNARPPMTLRVNLAQQSREEYLARLEAAGIAAHPDLHTDSALILATPCAVELLPGFADGTVSVQDAAAQLAAPLLMLKPGQRVLDACAAPGGKTGHILEYADSLTVVAIDKEAHRLERVAENLQRLDRQAELLAADAATPEGWWDGKPFERILLDAPCSATGVIRRHPDIKVLRRPEDIPALVAEQQRLLDALWPLLKPGGILVYATCSILPAENEQQVAGFLTRHADASPLPIDGQWGMPGGVGRQILPGQDEMDGFFYARLQKAVC